MNEEVLCVGGTVIAKNSKEAEKFEREYYESIGEKYEQREFTKFIDNAFICNEDLKKLKYPINDYEVLISLSDLGNRGNFRLIDKLSGDIVTFKNGKVIK